MNLLLKLNQEQNVTMIMIGAVMVLMWSTFLLM